MAPVSSTSTDCATVPARRGLTRKPTRATVETAPTPVSGATPGTVPASVTIAGNTKAPPNPVTNIPRTASSSVEEVIATPAPAAATSANDASARYGPSRATARSPTSRPMTAPTSTITTPAPATTGAVSKRSVRNRAPQSYGMPSITMPTAVIAAAQSTRLGMPLMRTGTRSAASACGQLAADRTPAAQTSAATTPMWIGSGTVPATAAPISDDPSTPMVHMA